MFLFIAVTCSGSTLGMGKAFFSRMKSKGIFLLHFRVTVKSRSKLALQLVREADVRVSASGLHGRMGPVEEPGC